MEKGDEITLEYTPTWVSASICSVIVLITLLLERSLFSLGKLLKKKQEQYLFQALQKIREELMLLGLMTLILTFFNRLIEKVCISKELASKWLPCKSKIEENQHQNSAKFVSFFTSSFASHYDSTVIRRRLLAEASGKQEYCASKGKVPLLSTTAFEDLDMFLLVLAILHVTFCTLTIVLGRAKTHRWKQWEDAAIRDYMNRNEEARFTLVSQDDFVRNRVLGYGRAYGLLSWLTSFCKQFRGSVSKSEYTTLRQGFIRAHCSGNPKFSFHGYLMRALDADFVKVVGISWYLWLFVVVFLLLNVYGWHAYFWIAFVPVVLLIAVGAKLEHIITQLAREVVEKHAVYFGDLIVEPSDYHFWFNRPQILLLLIHIILFQNSFELSYFAWIFVQYGFNSCMMGPIRFMIPRLVIGFFVQLLCSYSTLPLYVLVTQMGSSCKKEIFNERVQKGLLGWAKRTAKMRRKKDAANHLHDTTKNDVSSIVVELAEVDSMESAVDEDNNAEEIVPAES